jgi:hypothetical protein
MHGQEIRLPTVGQLLAHRIPGVGRRQRHVGTSPGVKRQALAAGPRGRQFVRGKRRIDGAEQGAQTHEATSERMARTEKKESPTIYMFRRVPGQHEKNRGLRLTSITTTYAFSKLVNRGNLARLLVETLVSILSARKYFFDILGATILPRGAAILRLTPL